uniref:phosphoethanolamine N-methyltransferase n=1 Tax=Romanomermis culicivorax TaxID=13658 RepID=A0A915J763_ROMCU
MGDRLALTEFWEKQAHAPTVETMMLNKLAEQVDEQDKRDIFNSLPDLEDMRIMELGAGIGIVQKTYNSHFLPIKPTMQSQEQI